MFLWLSVTVYLGVVKLQQRKAAWCRNGVFRQKWLRSTMKLDEFENICNAVNFIDHWSLSNEEFERRNRDNCFWQIDDILRDANANSQHYFKMGHRISIDEACVPWKGRHRARVFNPNKPAKFHLKKFMLSDSASGYCYNFYYYGGASEVRPEGVPATTWPVVNLLSTTTTSLHNKNHICALDNWFTSSHSFEWLASNGYEAVGTVRTGTLGMEKPAVPARGRAAAKPARPGFPNGGIFKGKTRNRASYVVHKGVMQKPGGMPRTCYVTAWQDRNPVHFLSTYPPLRGQCKRKIKVDGNWVEAAFPRPSVAHHYNRTMGGTDLHDQRVQHFRTVVKSRRWQVRVLTDTFTSMLQNAFILYHEYHSKSKSYSSLDFIEEFLEELGSFTASSESDDDEAQQHRLNEHKREYWVSGPGSKERLKGRHWIKDSKSTYAQFNTSTGKVIDTRRYCTWNPAVCGRTTTYCSSCMVPLCLDHFEDFHTCDAARFPNANATQ
jgi:hypothetical protein